jgi:phosphoglycolate phosphatase
MVKMGKEPWGLQKVKRDIHKSLRESFPQIFGDRWQEAGKIYQDNYHSNNLKKLEFLPGALDLIKELQKRKILMVVVSNKLGSTLRKEAEYLKVKDLFFATIGSSDAPYDKPSRDPVDLALEGSDLDTNKDLIWFIGDTLTDVQCALNSDCQPILLGEGSGIDKNLINKEKGNTNKPLLQFYSHKEILNFIK